MTPRVMRGCFLRAPVGLSRVDFGLSDWRATRIAPASQRTGYLAATCPRKKIVLLVEDEPLSGQH
jgi:hypothetical protein